MSFISVLETIGKDIVKGVEIAAPVIGSFVPAAGPILQEISSVILALEAKGQTLTSEQISSLVQTLSAAHSIKQSVVQPMQQTAVGARLTN